MTNQHKNREKKYLPDNSAISSHDANSRSRFYDWSLPYMPDELDNCRKRMRANLKFTYKQKLGNLSLQENLNYII